MTKNGLFLVSIGLILVMLSANAKTGTYDGLSLVTAAFLILSGVGLMLWAKRRRKTNDLIKQNSAST
ncbi:LPXTG cell wall anchor domain-containing protein [uncultured Vagococcus sp.]|uniref:LPXTG cell wall anchor domain-containing protein n=1 Tax=uncultured Vagococcus sp. TaxID=189676 RepID=UPI0028D2E9A2|nr:LPXTG cell wall anchor domain-containing protein [uncultured Vagococcus sp.]